MSELFEIIEHQDVSFDTYKKWFKKYQENNDTREINFQNEIIKPFISQVCPKIDITDISNKGPDSKNHDYFHYCGTYTDKNGNVKPHTPDLLITQKWNWNNIINDIDYRAVVEVKSPFGKRPIYNAEYINYKEDLKDTIKRHLSSQKVNRLILTDTLKWEFYDKNNKEPLIPSHTFELYEMIDEMIDEIDWKWKMEEKMIVDNEVIQEIFNGPIEKIKPLKEFEELKMYIKDFLNYED